MAVKKEDARRPSFETFKQRFFVGGEFQCPRTHNNFIIRPDLVGLSLTAELDQFGALTLSTYSGTKEVSEGLSVELSALLHKYIGVSSKCELILSRGFIGSPIGEGNTASKLLSKAQSLSELEDRIFYIMDIPASKRTNYRTLADYRGEELDGETHLALPPFKSFSDHSELERYTEEYFQQGARSVILEDRIGLNDQYYKTYIRAKTYKERWEIVELVEDTKKAFQVSKLICVHDDYPELRQVFSKGLKVSDKRDLYERRDEFIGSLVDVTHAGLKDGGKGILNPTVNAVGVFVW